MAKRSVGFNKSKWMPLEEAKKQVIDDIQKNMTEFIVSS